MKATLADTHTQKPSERERKQEKSSKLVACEQLSLVITFSSRAKSQCAKTRDAQDK